MEKEFLNSIIDDFIAFETENEKADNTIILYRRVVKMFVDYFSGNEITKMDIISFKKMLEKKYSPSTVKNHITIVNKFIKFAEIMENGDDPYEIRTHNSKMTLKNIKIQQVASLDNVIEASDYKRMIRKAKELGMMDMYLIMKIFAHTGIRVSELQFFTVENVKKNYITVNNKGKIREIILIGELKREILSYCRSNKIKEGKIFNLSYYTIYYRMKKIAGKCRGIKLDKVHPHSFRHLFAINYLESGGQVTDLMDILGHNSIQTTSLYTRTTNKTKKNQLEKMKY
ncbi:tyrosine-type recombinase/integrase [Floccifex sp.]|uniref:tyrosine-type recombinase/integrase n=1 Tax=Floccifex sp. TaxID=2815810 RepID=UPI003F12B292